MKKSLSSIGLTILLAAALQAPAQAAEHGHHNHDMKAMPSAAMEHKSVAAEGVINQIVTAENKLKVAHQPIAAWNMGAMQMTFHLAADVDISNLKEGQHIKFMLTNPKVGTYVITKIMGQ